MAGSPDLKRQDDVRRWTIFDGEMRDGRPFRGHTNFTSDDGTIQEYEALPCSDGTVEIKVNKEAIPLSQEKAKALLVKMHVGDKSNRIGPLDTLSDGISESFSGLSVSDKPRDGDGQLREFATCRRNCGITAGNAPLIHGL